MSQGKKKREFVVKSVRERRFDRFAYVALTVIVLVDAIRRWRKILTGTRKPAKELMPIGRE